MSCCQILVDNKAEQPLSAVDSGGAGDARVPPEFGVSLKGQSLISAYQSLAITASTSGFEKLSTVLSYLFATVCQKASTTISTNHKTAL